MADIKDVATLIASALDEASIAGTLDVVMDGGEAVETLGTPGGDEVEVVVTVTRLDRDAA